jgi:hypothetical protein
MKYIILVAFFYCLTVCGATVAVVPVVVIDTVLLNENVSYEFKEVKENIHVKVSTTDEKTIMSMLRLGVTVFFDTKGKKKQNVYVKYPSKPLQSGQRKQGQRQQGRRQQGQGQPNDEDNPTTSLEEGKSGRRMKIKELVETDYPQTAEYSYFDDAEEFHVLLNTLDISVSFTYDEVEGLFEYNLILPKTKINVDDKKDLSKLVIGVKTEKVKREKNNDGGLSESLGGINLGGQQSGGRSGGGQRGSTGGGGRQGGNSAGGRGQGQQGRGSQNNREQERPSDVLLDFWFKTNS